MSNTIILWILPTLQLLIALGLINVWVIRFNKTTKYRGGHARNMKEEFLTYGLPIWFMYVVGFLKITIALSMILVILVPSLMRTLGVSALLILSLLMLGAIAMHIKVKDSFTKTAPAILMFSVSLLAIYLISLI
jgi:hypothetical protein